MALAASALLAGSPAQAQEKSDVNAEANQPVTSVSADGVVIQSATGDFRIQLRAYMQFDGRFFSGDAGALAIDNFLIRRARPILQVSVGRHFEFQIAPDFGAGTTQLMDAFLDVNYSRHARVRVGKFKPPVGLERLQSATVTAFTERAYPTALVPNRDVGIQLHGELADGIVAYQAALLDGAPDGGSVDLDLNDGKDVAGRIFLSPFKRGGSVFKDLGFGIAGTTGKQTGPLPAYRSGGQISIITIVAGVTADGTRKRYTPQLSFYSGPFGLLAEYAQSESRVKTPDGTRVTLEGRAWQATATLALTGDAASYSGVRPRTPFDPGKGQWGALELAARVNGIELDSAAIRDGIVDATRSVRKAFAWGVGLNWSLTRNVKQMADFERTSFTGGAEGGDREPENALLVRTQVSF
jgi:phosphate-selective porin OprO/OprP